MHLFYTPDLSSDSYMLSEAESKHCIKVLRLVNGDMVQLIDGNGGIHKAVILSNHPKRCILSIKESQYEVGKRKFHLHIAIAPTKNIDKFEWFLEKATEIGIDEITPIICDRSERRVIKPERLEKIITSAIKQSVRAYRPILNSMVAFKNFNHEKQNVTKYIAHCQEDEKVSLKQVYKPETNALIFIGPEGDFSQDEVKQLLTIGYQSITLGDYRLRTETAGIVACHTVNLLNE